MVRTLLLGGAAALTALTFAVTGCSEASFSVKEDKVEETVQANLAPQIDGQVEEVDCPGDLRGQVGETMQCTMTVDGEQRKVDVTVSSVEGSTVNFNMRVVG